MTACSEDGQECVGCGRPMMAGVPVCGTCMLLAHRALQDVDLSMLKYGCMPDGTADCSVCGRLVRRVPETAPEETFVCTPCKYGWGDKKPLSQ